MAVKKVWIEEGCTACGLCEDICPEVFKLKDEATIIEGVSYADYTEKISEIIIIRVISGSKFSLIPPAIRI